MEGHKRNVCSKCSESFCSQKKLKAHMKSEHNFDLVSKSYSCETCKRSFMKRSSLYYHFKVHAAENEVCTMLLLLIYCGQICYPGREDINNFMYFVEKIFVFDVFFLSYTACTQSLRRNFSFQSVLRSH